MRPDAVAAGRVHSPDVARPLWALRLGLLGGGDQRGAGRWVRLLCLDPCPWLHRPPYQVEGKGQRRHGISGACDGGCQA